MLSIGNDNNCLPPKGRAGMACGNTGEINFDEEFILYMDYAIPNKQRIIDVLQHRKPDRVPNFEVLIDNPSFSDIMDRKVTGLDGHTSMHNIDPEDYMELARRIGQDVIGMNFYSLPFYYKDENGIRKPMDYKIRSRQDLERILPPSLEDLKPRFELLKRYAEAVKNTNTGLFVITGSIFSTLYDICFGFENFMLTLYDEFELIEQALEMATVYHEMMVEELVKYNLTFFYAGDDIAYKSSTLIRPDIMRAFWLPRMARILKPFKEKKTPVLYHSDGNIFEMLPDLIEIGVDAINPIEPYGMDIKEVRKKFGTNLTLFGNLDVGGNLSQGTPNDVKHEAEELIDAVGKDGGLVLCSSHSITENVPVENFLAMVETAQTYGIY